MSYNKVTEEFFNQVIQALAKKAPSFTVTQADPENPFLYSINTGHPFSFSILREYNHITLFFNTIPYKCHHTETPPCQKTHEFAGKFQDPEKMAARILKSPVFANGEALHTFYSKLQKETENHENQKKEAQRLANELNDISEQPVTAEGRYITAILSIRFDSPVVPKLKEFLQANKGLL